MFIRRRLVPLLVAAGIAFALPAQAQSPDPSVARAPAHAVSFDGFGFSFADDLGASVNVTTLLGVSADAGPFGAIPPSVRFSLYGAARQPRAGGQLGFVERFAVADLESLEFEASQLDTLRTLLADRPALGQNAAGSPRELPLLISVEAGQGVRGQASYIDTDDVSGILFVTAFVQNTVPFSSDSFTAVFTGLSADGTTAIVASFPLTTPRFPREISAGLLDRVQSADGWARYVRSAARRLDRSAPDDFTPSMDSVTALVTSITIADPAATDALPSVPSAPAAG